MLAGLGLTTDPQLNQTRIDSFVRFGLSEPASVVAVVGLSPGLSDQPTLPSASGEAGLGAATHAISPADSGGTIRESEDELEPEVDEEPSTTTSDARPVTSQSHDWTISALRDKLDRGFLILQPKYQREYVWNQKPELPSRLIGSLLLEIPIPPIYFGRISEGSIEVIDGQQRLRTLIDFVSNKFALRKLHSMGSLNGKFFRSN